MAIDEGFDAPQTKMQDKVDRLRILAVIGAKRTHEPAFINLFDRILEEYRYTYYREATSIKE